MNELANNDGTPARGNRGWFRRGDPRINREGRPKGTKALALAGALLAERADRLRVLWVPLGDVRARLCRERAPWIANLPDDFGVVACRVDAARGAVAFILRSATFPRVAQGTPIPEFAACYHGLRWRS